jgi:hypothetical protein
MKHEQEKVAYLEKSMETLESKLMTLEACVLNPQNVFSVTH